MLTRRRRLLLVACLAAALLPAQARAHAFLTGSQPSDGQQVATPPPEVVLTFSEPVSPVPGSNGVLDADGQRVDTNSALAAGSTVRIPLPVLPNGSYVVQWSVVSADGHPIHGAFAFSIGEPLSIDPTEFAAPGTPGWTGPAASMARGLLYLTVILAIGAMSFQFSVRPRADRVAWAPVWLPAAVIIAAGLALAAETLRLTNGDAGDLLGRDGWNLARDARHLPAALITISGAAALWLWIEWPRSWITAAASALMLALGLAWAGHSAAIDPRWLGTGIDTLHVVAVGAWAGGVATLAFVVLTRRDLPAASGLRRFSNTAGIAFAIAALSGLVLVREIAGGPGDLLESTWGRVLAVKVAVVLAAGVLAFVNRRHILRQIGGAGTATAGPLRRLVLAEAAALLLVVGLAATLTGQSPQDTGTDNAAAGRPYVADQFLGPYHVVVSLTPRAVGTNTLTVDFHGVSEGGETPPEAAEAVLSLADGPEGRHVLTNTAGSRFVGEGLEIGGPGDWTLTIELTLEGGETVSGAFPVRVNE